VLTLQASAEVIAEVGSILSTYTFRANNERDLQTQIAAVLESCKRFQVNREVVSGRGRYDILVESPRGVRLVLELKVTGTAEAVERQAQRYARDAGIDAVAVVTSSRRLALEILRGGTFDCLDGISCLGGKPFGVLTLRSF
jgi:hypothetical protein